jgi:hypothetical protein
MNLLQDIKSALSRSVELMVNGFTEALPKMILVILLLLIGWVLGKAIKKLVTKTLNLIKLDDVMERIELAPLLGQMGVKSTVALIGGIAYWMIMLLFILTITELLNIPILTQGVAAIIAYVPKFLVAMIIFLLGMFIANSIKKVVYNATHSIGLSGARVIANIVYYVLFIFIAITAINQTGIDTSIITSNVTLIFGAMLLAFAISYGFASRDIMTNILSGFYKKDRYHVGMHIKVQDVEGSITNIDSLSVTIDTGDELVVLPTRVLVDEKVEIKK